MRRRIRDPRLRVRMEVVGRRSRVRVALLYTAGITNPRMVGQVRRGLRSIDVDFIRGSNDVAELLFHHAWTPFPLVERTVHSDRVASALMSGRIAVLVEGTPDAILVPTVLADLLKNSEALLPPLVSGFVRLIRVLGLSVSLLTPGVYVALISVNTQVLPTVLGLWRCGPVPPTSALSYKSAPGPQQRRSAWWG